MRRNIPEAYTSNEDFSEADDVELHTFSKFDRYDPSTNLRRGYSQVLWGDPIEDTDNDIPNQKLLDIHCQTLDELLKCKNKYDKMRLQGMMLRHVI